MDYRRVQRSGPVFGSYVLLQRFDEVEIGEAYLAKRISIHGFEKRMVVHRVPRDERAARDLSPTILAEAKRAALLSHANIAHLLDLGQNDDMCFVATEYVGGSTLEEVLQRVRHLCWPIATHIVSETAKALSYAHARRSPTGELLMLVHRRCEPRRIALSSTGDVKVTGFGTSWAWRERDAYRSPEQLRNEPIDGRADVFALGVILRTSISPLDIPEPVALAVECATQPYPEHRWTARRFHEELAGILHSADQHVSSGDIAALTTPPLERSPVLRSA